MTPLPVVQPPRTRAECREGPRPCPHFGCRYHLAELWGAEPPQGVATCALDVAEDGEHSLEDLARLLGAPVSTIYDIEVLAKTKALKRLARAGVR